MARQDLGVIEDIAEYVAAVAPRRPEALKGGIIQTADVLPRKLRQPTTLFRGQGSVEWSLRAKIDRVTFKDYRRFRGLSRKDHERKLLSEFEKAARPFIGTTSMNDWDMLALAQHHGLGTRLLDWSTNPLAALYFAVEEPDLGSDSRVWIYAHTGKSESDEDHNLSPFSVSEIITYYPSHVSSRIVAQGGCFTVHPDSEPRWQGEIFWITVPEERRKEVRNQLARLGVTRATLFPGLDGLSENLNWRFSGKQGGGG